MCGICGDIRRGGVGLIPQELLAVMNQAQRHRGPDDSGIWIRDGVGLGHQRLSILDLGGGHQPMEDAAAQVTLTYNGEIYNYVELRELLRARGHRFRGTGDTEVLLQGYLEWGLEVCQRLNGMFAFALVDFRNRWVFAARDRMGQKPFLYHHDGEGLVFASELTALLRHPRVGRTLDREAIAGYLVRESFAAPATAFREIRKLPPGHCLLYRIDSGELRVWRDWDPLERPPDRLAHPATRQDEEEFAARLRDAVERHLRSDVPVGVYLSGGVDSTALCTLACDLVGGQNLQTFTIGFQEPSFDESELGRRTAHQLGTNHHELRLSRGQAVEGIRQAVRHLDEPLADPGFLSVYLAASLASRYVKVVLSGDGGDELLYGYAPFGVWETSERIYRQIPRGARRTLRWILERAPAQYGYMGLLYRARQFARGLEAPMAIRNTLWLSAFTPQEAAQTLQNGQDVAALHGGTDGTARCFDAVRALYERTQGWDLLARLGAEYQQGYLPDCICSHTDKANMLFSLEARSPFLDAEWVRYVNGLPSAWKLRGRLSKWLLRRWLDHRLGRPLARKKHGFTVPVAIWLRRDLREFAWRSLNPEAVRTAGLFRPAVVERLWKEHQRGWANHAKKLWTLAVFQAWVLERLASAVPPPMDSRRSVRARADSS